MKKAIERLIDDYTRRKNSAIDIIENTTDMNQFYRVSGKKEVYESIIRELKAVLAEYENDDGGVQSVEQTHNKD